MILEPKKMRAWGFAQTAVACVCLFTAVRAPHLRAQSLADVAREEEARRKTIKSPSKVYTNKDLVPVPPRSAPPLSAPGAAPPTSDVAGRSAGVQPAGDQEHADAAPASVPR